MFFFLTETSNAENKAFNIYRHACKNSHMVIISFYSRYITVNLSLKYVWDWHPLPSTLF